MPVAGGQTIYLSRAYSPMWGFLNGFSCFLLVGSGGVAALAMAAVTAYRTVFEISDVMVKVIAILIILVLMTINLLGVKEMTLYQNFSMVIRLVPIILIIIVICCCCGNSWGGNNCGCNCGCGCNDG